MQDNKSGERVLMPMPFRKYADSCLCRKLRRDYAYTRHPASLFRFLRKNGIFVKKEIVRMKHALKPYATPTTVGDKLQLDVKFVPKECYAPLDNKKFYQYTIIDEASRERFIHLWL